MNINMKQLVLCSGLDESLLPGKLGWSNSTEGLVSPQMLAITSFLGVHVVLAKCPYKIF